MRHSLLIAAFAALTAAGAAQEMPSVGAPAPGFTLNSQEGAPVRLSDYRGKWVVLYFYPRDMTSGCTIEAHNFQRDLAQYEKANAVVLGVSVDSVESHQQFCAKESLTFKLLSDPTHDVTAKYGSLTQMGATPIAARNTFLIDPNGVVRKVYTKVNPNPHSAELLADLAELRKETR